MGWGDGLWGSLNTALAAESKVRRRKGGTEGEWRSDVEWLWAVAPRMKVAVIRAACSKPTRTAAAELRDGAIPACCPAPMPTSGGYSGGGGKCRRIAVVTTGVVEASLSGRDKARAVGKAGGLASGGLAAFTLSDSRARSLRSAVRETLRRRKPGSSSTSASVSGRSTPSPWPAAMWEAPSSAAPGCRERTWDEWRQSINQGQ